MLSKSWSDTNQSQIVLTQRILYSPLMNWNYMFLTYLKNRRNLINLKLIISLFNKSSLNIRENNEEEEKEFPTGKSNFQHYKDHKNHSPRLSLFNELNSLMKLRKRRNLEKSVLKKKTPITWKTFGVDNKKAEVHNNEEEFE